MNCASCGHSMEKGRLTDSYWRPEGSLDQLSPKNWFMGAQLTEAWACQSCGMIQLMLISVKKD